MFLLFMPILLNFLMDETLIGETLNRELNVGDSQDWVSANKNEMMRGEISFGCWSVRMI
jgi:hypothetical protein